MKISTHGLKISPGKHKYNDPILIELEKKFQPKKFSPFFFEFLSESFDKGDAIAILASQVLDLLILDMEKLESRLERSENDAEKAVIKACLEKLESEIPLSEQGLSGDLFEMVKSFSPLSLKAVLKVDGPEPNPDDVMKGILEKSGHLFFYTAGKDDVRAWIVKSGSTALDCAGKIHSDLEKGFISAKVINFEIFKNLHNFHDAEQKGLMKTVKADFQVSHGDIIEIVSGNAKK